MPDDATNAEITNNSTIWLKQTSVLENLTITAKNMRYPVHSEDGGNNKDQTHNIINCRIEHLGNDGAYEYRQDYVNAHKDQQIPDDLRPSMVWKSLHAWGYGSASGLTETFKNTQFVSPGDGFYVHNRQDFSNPNINILNNCDIMTTKGQYAVKAQSMGSGQADKIYLNDCTLNGIYIFQDDGPWISQREERQVANHAEYEIIMNGTTPIGYKDGHRGRALAIFSNSTESNSGVSASGTAATDLLGAYTAKSGGGGLKGYLYGYWDISGIKVGINSDITVNNTIGRRLGDCTTERKTLNLVFDNDSNKRIEIVFDGNYTEMTNEDIIKFINYKISCYGSAEVYNVTLNEYYPKSLDNELNLVNSESCAIPRFSAVCKDENGGVRLMTAEDDKSDFLGMSLENILPGASGRILTKGNVSSLQLYGSNGGMKKDQYLMISASNPGKLETSDDKIKGVMIVIADDWASFESMK